MRDDWKMRFSRLEWEDWATILLLVLLVVGLLLVVVQGRCLACELDHQEIPGLVGTLAQSLSAIFAIAFSVTLVAVQMAAAAYTPRIIRLHTWHPYFVGLFATYLFTIGYLFLLGAGHPILGRISAAPVGVWVDVGLVLSLFSLGYLAPFTARNVRLLIPAYIVRALLRRIDREDFRLDRSPDRELQPVEDLIVRAIRSDDHQTAKEALRLVVDRFLSLWRPARGEADAVLLAGPFVDFLKRVARFCAQGGDFEMMEEVLGGLRRLSEPLVERGMGRHVDYVDATLREMEFMAQEWFEQGKSGVEMARIEAAIAGIRASLAAIMG